MGKWVPSQADATARRVTRLLVEKKAAEERKAAKEEAEKAERARRAKPTSRADLKVRRGGRA